MSYKRNQIEEAISRTIHERTVDPSPHLLTQMKRLLDLDRTLEQASAPSRSRRLSFAFYSAAPPGKGVEVQFSQYEAFALLLGTLLLRHRFPQLFIVETLRSIRTDLEKEHKRILNMNPAETFDPEAIARSLEHGNISAGNSSPALLVIASDIANDGTESRPYARIFQDQLSAFRFQLEKSGRSCTSLELVSLAWTLKRHLNSTIPRQRGRQS